MPPVPASAHTRWVAGMLHTRSFSNAPGPIMMSRSLDLPLCTSCRQARKHVAAAVLQPCRHKGNMWVADAVIIHTPLATKHTA
jgi:hypothetical protein